MTIIILSVSATRHSVFPAPQPQSGFETAKRQSRAKATLHSPRPTTLDVSKSAELRDRLLQELSTYETDEAFAVWAYRSLPLKNTLTKEDAEAVEVAYLAKVGSFDDAVTAEPQASLPTQEDQHNISPPSADDDFVTH